MQTEMVVRLLLVSRIDSVDLTPSTIHTYTTLDGASTIIKTQDTVISTASLAVGARGKRTIPAVNTPKNSKKYTHGRIHLAKKEHVVCDVR